MLFELDLANDIWAAKYRYAPATGNGDQGFADTALRVAEAVAQAEAPQVRDEWQMRFQEAIDDFRFLPAGRILSGAGTDRSVTLFNCFVMGTVPDSLGGIFEHLREAAIPNH